MKKDSKTRLLEAATKEFAKHGYACAATRDIAARAKVNISSIAYYFGSKEKMYKEVLKVVATEFIKPFEKFWPYKDMDVTEIKNPKDAIKDYLETLINTLLDEEALKDDLKQIFFAEYFKPSTHFDVLYDEIIAPFYISLSNLVIAGSKSKVSKEESLLHLFPFVSQIIVFSARQKPLYKLIFKGEMRKDLFVKNVFNQLDNLFNTL